MALLDVKNLRVRFQTHGGTVQAVDGVSFQLEEGETLGLVGESGSGKSVTNLALMGLVPSPPGIVTAEHVMFAGRDLTKLPDAELRKIRGNDIAMIFQDPMTSLNPLLTIERQLTEVLEVHKGTSRHEARKLAAKGLGDVGIPNPEARLEAYPHELSGGMRQRVMIAMGLLCSPRLLIADEPTTALDVTIQAQILELMRDLQQRTGTAIILVTHDLGVVAGMTDRVHVMYAGRLVETGTTEDLYARPLHPYTQGLLASVPTLLGDPDAELASIPGTPPDLAALGKGCAFGPRCELHTAHCDQERPSLRQLEDEVSGARRRAACFEVSAGTPAAANAALFESLERKEREAPATSFTWKRGEPAEEPAAESVAVADEEVLEPEAPRDEPVAPEEPAPLPAPDPAIAPFDEEEDDDGWAEIEAPRPEPSRGTESPEPEPEATVAQPETTDPEPEEEAEEPEMVDDGEDWSWLEKHRPTADPLRPDDDPFARDDEERRP